ncbi:MAG: hypothetical protein JO021_01460 [Alphaproteobacteria bacterium]|nr:hypothetical protein [Alphaproteobacteria bacterium]
MRLADAPPAEPSPPPPEGQPDISAFVARVRGTTICETTLLATDYLNHVNEIIMLIEMIPDMPEMLDEAKAWQPRGYVEHFRESAYPFRELAIELYPHVPARFKTPFETTIRQIDDVIARALRLAEDALAKNNPRMLRDRIGVVLEPMRRLVDVAGGIIHGSEKVLSQDEIDQVVGR